jgi:Resolvase, N terminal domain
MQRRAVLYLRVSTLDQTTANQERELREVAQRIGCTVTHVYANFSGKLERIMAYMLRFASRLPRPYRADVSIPRIGA